MKTIIKNLITIFSVLVFFTSCSNILGESNKKSETSEKEVNVKGYLSTSGNSRTAFVSFEGITWKVQAYNDKASKYADVDGSTFSISLPVGEWTLTAIGYDSTGVVIAAGTTKITVKENEPQENLIIQVIKAHGQGNIALKVVDKTEKAAKLVCSYKYLLNGNVTSAPDFTANFIDGAVTIKFENVYTGEAEITIYDAEDVKLFSCKEKINVLFEMTTDVFADCDYVKDGVLTITDEVLNSYAASQFDYPITLWNRKTSDYRKQYRKGMNVFGYVDAETIVTESLISGGTDVTSRTWCFGENESIYFAEKKSDSSGLTIEKYVPNRSNYCTTYEKQNIPVVEYTKTEATDSYVYKITNLTWSTSEGKSLLYVLYGTSTENNSVKLSIYDISDWNGESSITTSICDREFSASDEDTGRINSKVVNTCLTAFENDVFLEKRNVSENSSTAGTLKIFSFNLMDSNLEYQGTENDIDIYQTLSTEGYSNYSINNLYITEMTVINNCLCILISGVGNYEVPTGLYQYPPEYEDEPSYAGKYCLLSPTRSGSAGGIMRYNLTTKEFEEWPDGSLMLGCYSIAVDEYNKVLNENGYEKYVFEEEEISSTPKSLIIQPTKEVESKYFYGPRKIIARRPDELIIADDGYEWVDNDHFSDKNRIIKLNLKNWAITSVEDAGVMFDGYVGRSGCGVALNIE